jgi:hypothetical protein
MSASYAEKRISKRVAYPCDAECYGAGISPVKLRLGDISETGAFLDTLAGLRPGAQLHLRFPLGERQLDVIAEVRYVMPQIGVGVRFLDVGQEERAMLSAFVRSGSA